MWRAVWSYILPYRWIIWELGWAWGVGRRTGDIDYIGRAVWTNYHVLFYVWVSRPNLAMKCGTGGIWSHFLSRSSTVLPFLIVFSHYFMLSCVTLVDILYILFLLIKIELFGGKYSPCDYYTALSVSKILDVVVCSAECACEFRAAYLYSLI